MVPYAGAFVLVNFETLSGQQVLISTSLEQGQVIPMGADVMDKEGNNLGMVGQSGQIYSRINHQSGVLFVKWGDKEDQLCRINYLLPVSSKQEIVQLTAKCEMTTTDNIKNESL